MALSDHNAGLRQRSGSVNSTDPLVSFVYHLLRDHLPAGSIEGILQNHVLGERSDAEFCNGYLADYAKDVAKRLEPKETEGATGDMDAQVAYHHKALGSLYMRMAAAAGPSIRRILAQTPLGQVPESNVMAMASLPAPELVAFAPDSLGLMGDSGVPLWGATQERGESVLAFVRRFTDMAKDYAAPKEKTKPKMSKAEATSTIGKIIQTKEGQAMVAGALSGAVRHRLTREGKDPGQLVILNEGRPGEPLALHACSTGVDELSYHFSQMEFETTEGFLDRVKTEIVGLYPAPEQAMDDDEPVQDSQEPEPTHLEVLQMKVQDLNAKIPAGAQKWMVTDVVNHDPRDKGEATYFILWALHQDKNECKAELREKGPWTHIQITLDGLANGEPEPFSTEYHNQQTRKLLAKTALPPVAFETLAKLVVEINAAHHWSKYTISPEHNVGPTNMGCPRATLWALPLNGSPLSSQSMAQHVVTLEHWAMLSELNKLLTAAKTNPDILE